jgi:hypothetical protein
MRAFAVRTASLLVGFCFGSCFRCAAADFLPAAGIAGNTCVGMIEVRSPGCVLMGPMVGLLLGIRNNAFRATSFNLATPRRRRLFNDGRLSDALVRMVTSMIHGRSANIPAGNTLSML